MRRPEPWWSDAQEEGKGRRLRSGPCLRFRAAFIYMQQEMGQVS